MKPIRKVFLTFDVEDFVNNRSIEALRVILQLLRKYELRALFFITGHMAEKLSKYNEIVEMLSEHEIGYHSTCHSVRPTLLEYTDVASYEEARQESIARERSCINPLTGEIEGERGGICLLRELFPKNSITAFRAPDYCWSPPHLEALKDLGIEYDFSSKISKAPFFHKGITFYPYPVCHDWLGNLNYIGLVRSILRNKISVLNFHHWYFVNSKAWNHYYKKGNPKKLLPVNSLDPGTIENRFVSFELLLKKIQTLRTVGVIDLTPKMEKAVVNAYLNKFRVEEICGEIASWFRRYYGYRPRFLCNHFRTFFG